MTNGTLRQGLAAYEHDQRVLLRLMRKKGGGFTEKDFDRWYRHRELRRPIKIRPLAGDSLILGGWSSLSCGHWSETLELLQLMVVLGDVGCTKLRCGALYYHLPKSEAYSGLQNGVFAPNLPPGVEIEDAKQEKTDT